MQSSCPDDATWMEIAAGVFPAERSGELLEHASGCARCARSLAESVRLLSTEQSEDEDAVIATLETSSPKVQRQIVQRLCGVVPIFGRRSSHWWLAIAAALMILIGAAITFTFRASRQPPFRMLAEAYAKRRTIELRIPGAPFSAIRVERGAIADRPAELAEGEALIRRHLDRTPEDATWLHAKGLTEVLNWRYEDAIQDASVRATGTLSATRAIRHLGSN